MVEPLLVGQPGKDGQKLPLDEREQAFTLEHGNASPERFSIASTGPAEG
jgi:hypothetical protein